MSVLTDFLDGSMEIEEFRTQLKSNEALQAEVRFLLPDSVIENKGDSFWKHYSYEAYKRDAFDTLEHIKRICRFDNSFGDNLNIFGIILRAYRVTHPDFVGTSEYDQLFDCYLENACEKYEGEEVLPIIQGLIKSKINILPKSKRNKIIKDELRSVFHIIDNKYPRWIQGAEWPMGKESPMQYISSKRIEDGKEYLFKDFETGEERVITQYY